MKRYISNLAIGAAFAVAGFVGLPAPMAGAVTMPADATYIADMTAGQAEPMTLAVTVDNDKVVAYATNGTNEEAWFFGSENAGNVDMTFDVRRPHPGQLRREDAARHADDERRHRHRMNSAPPRHPHRPASTPRSWTARVRRGWFGRIAPSPA